jgi:tetratricopeptide (TPR) repeat protein
MLEQKFLNGDTAYRAFIGDDIYTMMEIALDYAHAGLFSEALDILNEAPATDPMVKYYAGWIALQNGDTTGADAYFREAQAMSPDYCFPHQIESVLALQAAIQHNPSDARAPYYLGNFWYAHRRYAEAISAWEQARELDPEFPTVHRNLGLAYMNKLNDAEAARLAYEQAFALDPSDGRVLFELDQLDKQLGRNLSERVERLDQHLSQVDERDDLTIERVTLLNLTGRHEEALNVLLNRTFHPWEGGEGKVTAHYVASLVEMARQDLQAGAYENAIRTLKQAMDYPLNLGEGKLAGARDTHINFLLGEAYAGLGDQAQAASYFEAATQGDFQPASQMYYNDQPPEMIFYQGLARRALGRTEEADAIFQSLVDYGRKHLNDEVQMDYFAVSLPDFLVFDTDMSQRNQLHCHFMIGLGLLGLGKKAEAQQEFDIVLAQQPDHVGAFTHRVWEDPSGLTSNPVHA